MEITKAPVQTDSTFWESVRQESLWGQYLTSKEHRALEYAQQLVGNPSNALEIGCDGGYWSKHLAEKGWQMVCTDVDQQALSIAKQRIPSATCIRVSPEATLLPCASASVSMIVVMEVFQVVTAEWFPAEAARVLKKGGVFVGVVTNRFSWRGQAYQIMRVLDQKRKTYDEDPFIYKHRYADWRQKLAATGFRLTHEEGIAWLPFPRKSNSPMIPSLTRLEHMFGLVSLPKASPWVSFVAQKR